MLMCSVCSMTSFMSNRKAQKKAWMPCFLSKFEAAPFVGSANNVYHSKFVGIIR